MKVVKVISTTNNDLDQLMTKILKSGRSDVQEVATASVPGVDSNPVKDEIALYEITDVNGENFVIGFLLKNRQALPGEVRIYCTNEQGVEQQYIWLKQNGEIHFGGDTDNLTRYQQTADSINELKDSINDLKQIISGWIPVPNDGGAALKTELTSWLSSPLIEDITGAKIDEFKTL